VIRRPGIDTPLAPPSLRPWPIPKEAEGDVDPKKKIYLLTYAFLDFPKKPTTSGVTDGEARERVAPWQATCKNWAPFS